MALRKPKKGKVNQAAIEAAVAPLQAEGVENPFMESNELDEAWDKTKKQHLEASMKVN